MKADAGKQVEALLEEAKVETRRLLAAAEQQRQNLQVEAERLRAVTDQTSAGLRSLLVGMLEKLEDQAAEEPEEASPAGILEQLRPSTGESRRTSHQ